MEKNLNSQVTAKLSGMISFKGTTVFVYEFEGQKYLPIKIITDIVGLDWRTSKRKLNTSDNVKLYGLQTITIPKVNESGTSKTNVCQVSCIRLDRVGFYLARVNTSKVRAMENYSSANFLLELQSEWAVSMQDILLARP